ncbi:MAG TPA: CCA tRNA nucleotidyltransferase [Stellaceae bacterium]|jgi:poly(A) polymerase|nr:CCA tRNA nucleotidyltransferase [Stellaceae bacterium]
MPPPSRIAPQPWLQEPATQALLAAFGAAGIAVRFVGGCVRDSLLGRDIADLDLATPARPEAILAALRQAGIKAVPTGIAHGTVTAIVPPRHFEITTLRRDTETDGRHARVAFDADWHEDATRRDFTINAIYLDPDGVLHDPVGGLADLPAHRVRFVGDAARRIDEDVLRILRYYRFEARFGGGDGDAAARAACHAAASRLSLLSAERVAQELLRLLDVPNPMRALRLMTEDGVLAALLPEAIRLDRLARLIQLDPAARDPLLRLAAIIDVTRGGAAALAQRLHLSNASRDRLAGLAPPWPIDLADDDKARRLARYRLGKERYRDLARLVAAEHADFNNQRLTATLTMAAWEPPVFPLGGNDVTALGIAPGHRVGQLLADTRRWWEDGDFTADRIQCLDHLRQIAGTGNP